MSGAVRYTAKQERATTPVHLVLCENWAMVSAFYEASTQAEQQFLYYILALSVFSTRIGMRDRGEQKSALLRHTRASIKRIQNISTRIQRLENRLVSSQTRLFFRKASARLQPQKQVRFLI